MICENCGNTDLNKMTIVAQFGSEEEIFKEVVCEECGATWLSYEDENNEFQDLTREKA